MSKMRGTVLLVGSVPLETAEEVYRTCAKALGPLVDAYPDGEIGDRKYWTFYLPRERTPCTPISKPSTLPRRARAPARTRMQAPGVGSVLVDFQAAFWSAGARLSDAAYVEEAERSYATFRRLRRRA